MAIRGSAIPRCMRISDVNVWIAEEIHDDRDSVVDDDDGDGHDDGRGGGASSEWSTKWDCMFRKWLMELEGRDGVLANYLFSVVESMMREEVKYEIIKELFLAVK
jgi:hypothetical protein